MPDAAAAIPSGLEGAGSSIPAPAPVRQQATPPSIPGRISLCFARTLLGDEQVRQREPSLAPQIARLLLLFEGPQTVADLRRMIDEPWLPEALIDLERRRLIHRVTPAPASASASASTSSLSLATMQIPGGTLASNGADSPQSAASVRAGGLSRGGEPALAGRRPGTGDPALDRRRAVTRITFLRLLGSLGSDMGRRIDQCRSDHELDELMPQVDALIEAIAGHEALGQFRQQTTRSS